MHEKDYIEDTEEIACTGMYMYPVHLHFLLISDYKQNC